MTTDQIMDWAVRDLEYADAMLYPCTWCGARVGEPYRLPGRARTGRLSREGASPWRGGFSIRGTVHPRWTG
jgi:hypothetical protein